MKTKFLSTQSRNSTSERFDAARLALLAATQWRSVAKAAEQGLGDARAALGDPRVQAETKALLVDLTSASRRAREIGLTKAFDDKRLSSQLSRASVSNERGRRRARSSSAQKRHLACVGCYRRRSADGGVRICRMELSREPAIRPEPRSQPGRSVGWEATVAASHPKRASNYLFSSSETTLVADFPPVGAKMTLSLTLIDPFAASVFEPSGVGLSSSVTVPLLFSPASLA